MCIIQIRLGALTPENKQKRKMHSASASWPQETQFENIYQLQRETEYIASLLSSDQTLMFFLRKRRVYSIHNLSARQKRIRKSWSSFEQGLCIWSMQSVITQLNIFTILMGNAGALQMLSHWEGNGKHRSYKPSLRLRRCQITCDTMKHSSQQRLALSDASEAKLRKSLCFFLKRNIVKLLHRCWLHPISQMLINKNEYKY